MDEPQFEVKTQPAVAANEARPYHTVKGHCNRSGSADLVIYLLPRCGGGNGFATVCIGSGSEIRAGRSGVSVDMNFGNQDWGVHRASCVCQRRMSSMLRLLSGPLILPILQTLSKPSAQNRTSDP